MQITGQIESGAGKGAFFTSLDWVVEQFDQAMGFKPFPGTLNVRVSSEGIDDLEALFSEKDFEIHPDNPEFCAAGFKRVWVEGIPAAAVFPSEDVRIHGKDVIEIIAGRHIKSALSLADGDEVTITDCPLIWHERKVRGVIFDLDGTLTNSIEVYFTLFKEGLAAAGIDITRKEVLEPLSEGIGAWDHVIPMDLQDREDKIRQLKKRFRGDFMKALAQVKPLPEVDRVLEVLADRGIKLGLVTDSPVSSLRPLEENSLVDHFRAIITRDDGFPRKPAPDGILECLRRMGVSPDEAISIGDALLDVRAGRAAGTLTIGVMTGLASPRQFDAESPTALVDHVSDIPTILNLE
jgi:HAD superfamily hydrolase (TIGR01509 family)